MANQDQIWAKEASFHDEWADTTTISQRHVYESFESFLSLEGCYTMQVFGNVEGKKVLDLGSGLGESAVYFATKGADVTAVDVSSKMISSTQALANHYNVNVNGVVSPAEAFDLPENHFDFCYCANLLHHVTDHNSVIERVYKVLKPGGTFVSWDPLAYNPVINVYRRITQGGVRTIDEQPLTFDILNVFGEYFNHVEHKESWVLSNLIFLKYFMINRYDPNKVRYWKRILEEKEADNGWLVQLLKVDNFLLRFRPFQYLAWTILIHARKS